MRLLDFFFLGRPVLVAVVLIFPLVGARGMSVGDPHLWVLLLQDAALVASAFVLNQLHDRVGDRVNGKCPTLERGLVTTREAWSLALGLLALGLAAALWLGPWHVAGALLFFALSAWAYNFPPLNARNRPVLAPFLAAPAYLLLVGQAEALSRSRAFSLETLLQSAVRPLLPDPAVEMMAPLVVGMRMVEVLQDSLPMVLAGLSLSFLSTVPDVEGDRVAGKRTWAVAWGGKSTWSVAILTMGMAFALALGRGDALVALPALLSVFLMLGGRRHPEDRVSAETVLRVSVLLQALALCGAWPGMVAGGALLLAASRLYYEKRLQLEYPRLGLEGLRGLWTHR